MSPHKDKREAPRTFASPLDGALFMAARGYRVFPLLPNSKDPFEWNEKRKCKPEHRSLAGGINIATRNEKRIRSWAETCAGINFGVHAGDGVIIDVDMKNGKDGFAAYKEKFGNEPKTFRVNTPSGGSHLYHDDEPRGQRPLISGHVDIRSHNGYVVAPGSTIDGKSYTIMRDVTPLPLPANVREALARKPEKNAACRVWLCKPDNEHDIGRATDWLKSGEEVPHGQRNVEGFKVAAHLKDLGISTEKSAELMIEHWKCDLEHDVIEDLCHNAHKSGQMPPGYLSLECFLRDFEDIFADPLIKELAAEMQERMKKQRPPLVWPVMIGKGDKERPDPNAVKNVAAMLEHLGVRVRLNEFSGEREVKGLRHCPLLNDCALNALWSMARQLGLNCTVDALHRLISVLADRNRYHPVRDYLDGLKWDGKPRLDAWLSVYAGAEATNLNSHFGRVFLLGAVRRILEPGCKFDTALLLQGDQGSGKSSLVRILGGDWYADSLRLGMDPKETIERTRGSWIQEIPELGGMQSREIEAIKAQITTQADRARGAYARTSEVVPRQFVMLLTTNDETPLKDRTGNRRFLPVRAGQIDLAALQRDRDQLWAEAYKRAKDGEPAVLPSSVWAEARAVQSASVELDPITERLTEVLEGLSGRVLKEDLWLAVGRHHAANRTQREKNSLTAAMREQGWKAERHRYKKGRKRECYAKGSDRWLDWDAGDAKFA